MAIDRLVVFFRHNNDIDHISPVIYKWLDLSISPVEAIVSNNIRRTQDYRLKYLNEFQQFNIWDLNGHEINYPQIGPPPTSRKYRKELFSRAKSIGREIPSNIPERIFNRFKQNWSRERAKNIIDSVVNDGERALFIFDWPPSEGAEYNRIAMTVDVAQKSGHICVCLPHGGNTFTNAITTFDRFDTLHSNNIFEDSGANLWKEVYSNWERMDIFDHLIVPNEHDKRRAQNSVRSDKLSCLGLARYSSEWISILDEIAPTFDQREHFQLKNGSSQNIVIFLSPNKAFVSKEMILLTIKMISQLSQSKVVIQNHPRTPLIDYSDLQKVAGNDQSEIAVVDDIPSASLINWSDTILHTSSSVVLDPISRNKDILTLEYAHGNRSIISNYMGNTSMETLDETHDTLSMLYTGTLSNIYNVANREKFMFEIINGGKEGDILRNYLDFLVGM